MRDVPLREDDTEEGNGLMTPPRKTPTGSPHPSRSEHASAAPVDCTQTHTPVDDALIAASGIDARSVLIVTRDHGGAMQVWYSTGDMRENLRLVEFARGELTVRALCASEAA